MKPGRYNLRVLAEALVLCGLALAVLVRGVRGGLTDYIHPNYAGLVMMGATLLLVLGLVHLRTWRTPATSRAPLALIALPLFATLLVPAQPLTSASLGRFELGRGAAFARPQQLPQGDPARWDLLQWATAIAQYGPQLAGQPVDVVGFVVPLRDAPGTFVVARYVIACCTADASGVGLPVLGEGNVPPTDSWVRVRGTLVATSVDGQPGSAIAATSVEAVDAPTPPYLFP
jgi:uncharacterized repeat protein (TIGR03943 family)